jgi:hypothetical protein
MYIYRDRDKKKKSMRLYSSTGTRAQLAVWLQSAGSRSCTVSREAAVARSLLSNPAGDPCRAGARPIPYAHGTPSPAAADECCSPCVSVWYGWSRLTRVRARPYLRWYHPHAPPCSAGVFACTPGGRRHARHGSQSQAVVTRAARARAHPSNPGVDLAGDWRPPHASAPPGRDRIGRRPRLAEPSPPARSRAARREDAAPFWAVPRVVRCPFRAPAARAAARPGVPVYRVSRPKYPPDGTGNSTRHAVQGEDHGGKGPCARIYTVIGAAAPR